ncbi:MAG: hypothetical protein AB8B82_09235 [Roseovarius sp.]
MAKKKTSKSKADPKSAETDASQDINNLAETAPVDTADDPVATDAQIEDVTSDSPVEADERAEQDAATTDETIEDSSETDVSKPDEHAPIEDGSLEAEQTLQDPEPEPAKSTPAATGTTDQQGGFIPLLLGGLLAGGIGFAASHYLNGSSESAGVDALNKASAQIKENASAIAALDETVGAAPDMPDLTPITDAQGNMSAALDQMTGRLDAVEAEFAALSDRLTEVEKRPMTEGASDAAVAAYERELQALQDTMAAQRAEIEAMAEDARAMEGNAEATAKATMLRAALSRVQTAIDSGSGFAPALGDLQAGGIEVPAALFDVAEDGVMSLAQLQSGFPDAARAALAVSRQEAAQSGEQSGFSAFLKNQLGTRSLEPREGNDPDAVLSRAEAAVREGRLADTMAELEALPEAGRAVLADWTANVTLRQAAVSAVEVLGQELN